MEALENPGPCAFCTMHAQLSAATLHSLAGPSVAYMEGDVREATNKAGFCPAHLKALYASKNRLGLALMLHTHLMEVNSKLTKFYSGGKKSFFAKGPSGLPEYLAALDATCYLCTIIDTSFERYLDTFFALFSKEDKVKKFVTDGDGVCLPHLAALSAAAPKSLSAADLRHFTAALHAAQTRAMDKIQADLDWFIKKFDYRNQNEPWHDAKDAVERAMALLAGGENAQSQ